MRYLFLILLIISCTPKYFSLPDWYLNPPANNTAKIYGAGRGVNMEEAKKSALNSTAERLKITISSTFDLTRKENSINDQSIYSEDSKQKILSQVEEIDFNNFSIDKSANVGDNVYLLVSVDRPKLIKFYSQKLTEIENKMASLYKSRIGKFILRQKQIFEEIKQLSVDARTYAYLLETLEASGFVLADHVNLYQKYDYENRTLTSKITIFYNANGYSNKVKDLIRKKLTTIGIKSVFVKGSNPNLVIAKIDSDITYKLIAGYHNVKMNVQITLSSGSGTTYVNTTHEASGSSSISQAQAINAAIVNLEKQIDEKGILKFLNIENE